MAFLFFIKTFRNAVAHHVCFILDDDELTCVHWCMFAIWDVVTCICMAEENREVSQTQDDMAISYLDAQMGIKYFSLQISVSYFIISLILNSLTIVYR